MYISFNSHTIFITRNYVHSVHIYIYFVHIRLVDTNNLMRGCGGRRPFGNNSLEE